MAAQKHKKKFIAKISGIFKFLLRLSENPKTGDSRELFQPENDFNTCSEVNFLKKKIHILEAWKQTKDIKFRLEFIFTCPAMCELDII